MFRPLRVPETQEEPLMMNRTIFAHNYGKGSLTKSEKESSLSIFCSLKETEKIENPSFFQTKVSPAAA